MAKIVKVNIKHPQKEIIKEAAKIIKSGGIVIFPTETVYGVGTNALLDNSVKKIFKIKKRPKDQPLQILIPDIKSVKKYAKGLNKKILKIFKKNCPGPFTFILKKKKLISNIVTGGKNTVGIRIPDHPVILNLLKETNVPIAATSANRHNYPPPKTAKIASKELPDVDLILDGGRCKLGIPSAVVDLTDKKMKILRKGGSLVKS